MGWLHRLLNGEDDDVHDPAQAPARPSELKPPALPPLASHDPAGAHKRTYASRVCPSCGAEIGQLSPATEACKDCGEPIVVRSGEDGQWHLMRQADIAAFEAQQEQARRESYKQDEAALLEAGFLIGDQQVDVVGEDEYQDALERLAGGRSKSGVIKPVIALLSREPDHPHDKNAVRVDVDGETVGYIEKWNAKDIQPLLLRLETAGRPAWVRGSIVGGWEDNYGDSMFRVRLDSLPRVS